MLITLAGLPGTGKTTMARMLAREIGAAHVRIDSIEEAIARSGISSVGTAGYVAGYAVAHDQLRAGLTVVADSVNPLPATRDAWADVASAAGAALVEVEVVCSDMAEHRRRIEGRHDSETRVRRPQWSDVVARTYEPWDRERLVLDTAVRSPQECVALVLAAVQGVAEQQPG